MQYNLLFSFQNLILVALTYGVTQAFGEVIALIPPMTIAMSWFPEKKALATGIVVGGFGGGSFIWNQVQTAIINPDNVDAVDNGDDGDKYFEDEEVLNRVPKVMLISAGIYFAIQVLCMFLIQLPETSEVILIHTEKPRKLFAAWLRFFVKSFEIAPYGIEKTAFVLYLAFWVSKH